EAATGAADGIGGRAGPGARRTAGVGARRPGGCLQARGPNGGAVGVAGEAPDQVEAGLGGAPAAAPVRPPPPKRTEPAGGWNASPISSKRRFGAQRAQARAGVLTSARQKGEKMRTVHKESVC